MRIIHRESVRDREVIQRISRDEELLNRELEEATNQYMIEQDRENDLLNDIRALQRSPYPRRATILERQPRNNLPNERQSLVLSRQEFTIERPPAEPEIREENISQNSGDDPEFVAIRHSILRNRGPTPNPRHY